MGVVLTVPPKGCFNRCQQQPMQTFSDSQRLFYQLSFRYGPSGLYCSCYLQAKHLNTSVPEVLELLYFLGSECAADAFLSHGPAW